MQSNVSRDGALWRDALRELPQFLKNETHWVAILAGIVAIEQFFPFAHLDLNALLKDFKVIFENGDTPGALNNFLMKIGVAALIGMTTTGLMTYVFTLVYLRRAGGETAPSFSFKSFSFWLWNMVRKYWIMVYPFLGAVAVYSAIVFFSDSSSVQYVVGNIFIVLALLWIFYFYYGFFLYFLVSPLAILRDKAALDTSAKLTKNYFMQIVWGLLVVWGVVFVFFIPVNLIGAGIVSAFGLKSPQSFAYFSLSNGLSAALLEAAMAVYSCVVCRILMERQKDETKTSAENPQ